MHLSFWNLMCVLHSKQSHIASAVFGLWIIATSLTGVQLLSLPLQVFVWKSFCIHLWAQAESLLTGSVRLSVSSGEMDGPRCSGIRKKRKSRSVRDRERVSNGIRNNHVRGTVLRFSSDSEREDSTNPSSSHDPGHRGGRGRSLPLLRRTSLMDSQYRDLWRWKLLR